MATDVSELPPGFVLDESELPPGFAVDSAPAQPAQPARVPAPRQVGDLESAGRTVGAAAVPVVRTLGLAGAAIASIFGDDARDRVFRQVDETLQSMRDVYAPKEGEEFSTAGSLIGGVASAPIEMVGGFGLQHGIERSAQVLERGGTGSEAAQAGVVTGGVRAALNALPIKAGGRIGAAIESKLGGVVGGAATGGAIAGIGGAVGRTAENAALPEGEQFEGLRAETGLNAAEVGLGAALGAVPGAARAGSQALRDAKAKKAKLAAPENEAIVAAIDAGYKLTPKAGKAGRVARVAETAAGSPRLAQELSAHNAENTARLARQDVGLPDDVPLTRDATKKLRDEAGQDYAAVRGVGRIALDEQLGKDLDTIAEPYIKGGKDFEALAKNPIIKTIEGLRKSEADTDSVIEIVKDLRNEADKAFRANDKKLGSNYRAAAQALDNSMDRALGKIAEAKGDPELARAVDNYRAARVRIAKSYLLDDAMDGKPGEVNAQIYARALKKGAPLTGPAKQIAEFAKQFGDEGLAKKKGRSGSIGPTYHDILLGALHAPSLLAAIPAAVARPLTRAALGSDMMQRRMAERARAALPEPEAPVAPPEPTLGLGFEPQAPRDGAPPNPLGDLTPDFTTELGAAPPREAGIDPTGLVPAIDEGAPLPQGVPERPGSRIPLAEDRPLGDLTPDFTTELGAAPTRPAAEVVPTEGLTPAVGDAPVGTGNRKTRLDIPAIEGRPDLPGTMIVGAPAEVGADAATGAAMQSEGAALARQTQVKASDPRLAEIERLRAAADSDAVRKVLDEQANAVKKELKTAADADALDAAAKQTSDPALRAALEKKAAALRPKKPAPVEKTEAVGPEPAPEPKPSAARGDESLDFTGLPRIDESFLLEQLRTQQVSQPAPPTGRGIRQVRKTLEEGAKNGVVDKDGAALALWALDRNPHLARGLKVELAEAHVAGAKGAYYDATQIVKLFADAKKNPTTAAHEILHHSERMMPPQAQAGIRRAWKRELDAVIKTASKRQRAAFGDALKAMAGDTEAKVRVMQAFKDGVLVPEQHYHLINPSEYWAVNAARILHERFVGRGSWRAEAKRWLTEFIEHAKSTLGLRSDAPILKALNEVLSPSKVQGQKQSPQMLKSTNEAGEFLDVTGPPDE